MKQAISFLGGAVFVSLIVVASAGKPAILLFLGAGLALSTLAAAVWIAGLPRTIRLLTSLSEETPVIVERTKPGIHAMPKEANTKSALKFNPEACGYKKRSSTRIKQDEDDAVAEALGFLGADDPDFVSSRRAS